jgi:hypothetical protein
MYLLTDGKDFLLNLTLTVIPWLVSQAAILWINSGEVTLVTPRKPGPAPDSLDAEPEAWTQDH